MRGMSVFMRIGPRNGAGKEGHMKKNKTVALALAGAMAASMAGCGAPAGPKDAAELIGRYREAMEGAGGCHVDMEMEFGISASGDGMSIDVPIGMDISADIHDDGLHGDMGMSLSFMGQSMDESAEVYMDGSTVYSYDKSSGYWTVSENGASASLASGLGDIDPKAFEGAQMAYDKGTGTYTVTQSLADFASAGDTYGLLEDVYGGMTETMGMSADEFLDHWEQAEVSYVFDKGFLLQSMEIDGCEYSGTVEEGGVSMDVKVSLGLSYEFSRYGEVTEADVAVPEDVKEGAVPSVGMELPDGSLDAEVDPGFSVDPVFPDEDPGARKPDADEEESTAGDQSQSMSDGAGTALGSIGGMRLTAAGDSWDDTFGADGWEFGSDDAEYMGIYCVNGKYPGAELEVFNKDMEGTTREDIKDAGVFSYEVDFLFAETDERPDMEWNGITFGASLEEVQAAYGECSDLYDGDMWTSCTYAIGDAEVTFYVSPETGLQHVSVDRY